MTKQHKPLMTSGNPKNPGPIKRMGTTKSTLVLAAVGLLLIAGAGYYAYRYKQYSLNSTVNNEACSSASAGSLLKQGSEALDPDKTVQLGTVTDKIKKLPNYEKDPNCLYIVVSYYIRTADRENARLYLGKLERVLDPNKGFGPYLPQARVKGISVLKADVEFLEKANEELKQSIITVPNAE